MAAEVLRMLIVATLASSAAIVFALQLRKPLRALLGARSAYAVWALVPCATAVALLPAPTKSVVISVVPTVTQLVAVSTAAGVTAAAFDPTLALLALWLTGVALALALCAGQQRRFVRSLGRLQRTDDGALRAQATTGCPALVGALWPRIVLPADFEQRYDANERSLILAHERAHRARGDAQVNALAAALRCLHWFNPLFHFAASRFRFDQELACDAAVITRFPEARRSYADAMLKTQLADLGLPAGCHWQSSHPLKERISMLKQPLPGRTRRALGATVAVAFVAAGTYVAWAAQPAAAPVSVTLAGADAIRADIVMTIDDRRDPPLSRVVAPGEPFIVADDAEPDHWELHSTVTPRDGDTFEFDGTVKRAGAIVGKPRLIVRDGEPAGIKVGDEKDGTFHGFAAQILLARASANSTPAPTDAVGHASYRRLSRIAYPASAVAAKHEGVVYVDVHVAADGSVTSADVERGAALPPKELAEAAVVGVKRWTFDPTQRDGKPVASDEVVPIVFALDPNNAAKATHGTLDAIQIAPP